MGKLSKAVSPIRKIFTMFIFVLMSLFCTQGQTISDKGYATVAHVKEDGTIQDKGYRTVGHIKKDGTIQDRNYRTIGQ